MRVAVLLRTVRTVIARGGQYRHVDRRGRLKGLGHQVEGTITRMKHFGAFVEVYPGVEALLPSKDIMEHEQRNATKLEVGQTIKTYIVKFNPDERRISLSFQSQPLQEESGRFPPREHQPLLND